MKKGFLILTAIILIFSCTESKRNENAICEATYTDHFSKKLSGFWQKTQITNRDRAILVEDSMNPSNTVLKISIQNGDSVAKGLRNELVLRPRDSFGYLNTHSVKFKLPKSFFTKEEAPGKIAIMQWHDKPFPGFTWETSKLKLLPPFYLYIQHSPEGEFMLRLHTGLRIGNIKNTVYAKWPGKLEPDTWYTLKSEIFWSLYDDGYIKVSVNDICFTLKGEAVCTFSGPNMYHTEPNYLKMGLYYNGVKKHPRDIYFDDFEMHTFRKGYFPEDN